jgi:hypothetical protein
MTTTLLAEIAVPHQRGAGHTPELPEAPDFIRTSELISALSYALDLTEGRAMGHSVRSCMMGMRLARHIGMPVSTVVHPDCSPCCLFRDVRFVGRNVGNVRENCAVTVLSLPSARLRPQRPDVELEINSRCLDPFDAQVGLVAGAGAGGSTFSGSVGAAGRVGW